MLKKGYPSMPKVYFGIIKSLLSTKWCSIYPDEDKTDSNTTLNSLHFRQLSKFV